MKIWACLTFCALALPVYGQTEADILSYGKDGPVQVRAGQLTQLAFYKELFRRIQLTPSSEYPFKAENLRIIGQRIDVYEAVDAGQITAEKAERLIAEQQAAWERSNQDREGASHAAREQQEREIERQRRMAAAQDDAQRRALALQLLQGYRAPAPVQLQPYQRPIQPQTNCTSQWIGQQLVTRCQ